MGSFIESNYQSDEQSANIKKYSLSDILYIYTIGKFKKTIKYNVEKTLHVNSNYWLNYPTGGHYLDSNRNKIDNGTLKIQLNNEIGTKWNENLISDSLKYIYDFDSRLMNIIQGSSMIRIAGGGGSKCGKKKKACSDRCVAYDNKTPFDFLLSKKDKKPKKITCQRSDICCENWNDYETSKVEKKCSTDACAKCEKRKNCKNSKIEYYADCLKEHDKSLGKSECQIAWEASQRVCNCGKICDDLNVTSRMQKLDDGNENWETEPNVSSNDSCDICLNNKAVESYKIKKGTNQGHIKLCSECATKVDKNVKECTIRSTAGGGCCKKQEETNCEEGTETNCEEGKCVKDCKKFKTPKSSKSSSSKPCCPNCTRKTEPESSCAEDVDENPCKVPKKKSSSYCCNYSKNKKKGCEKGKIEVCEQEKCTKKKSKRKESDESKSRTLCECPKGCRCLCSKYSFFESTLEPAEPETSIEKPVTVQKSDCEDPQVNEMIEELKSEMGSLLKKLEVLGKSQCKCAMKREEVVLFATQVVNNPFDANIKLSRYIDINKDSIVRSNHEAINKTDILELNTNTTFIMPPNNNQINDDGSLCATPFTSKSSIHQDDKSLQGDESPVIIEKLPKTGDLWDVHKEELDNLENKQYMHDLLNKGMVKNNSFDTKSSSLKQQSTNNMENKIEIVSAKVIKDSNNKKQKLLLHLHLRKGRKMINQNA